MQAYFIKSRGIGYITLYYPQWNKESNSYFFAKDRFSIIRKIPQRWEEVWEENQKPIALDISVSIDISEKKRKARTYDKLLKDITDIIKETTSCEENEISIDENIINNY